MRDVFSNAAWIVAWMGPSADGSDKLLRDIRKVIVPEVKHSPLAIQSFFSRAWWQHMWILQEFIVSKNLLFLCGHEFLDEDMLQTFCEFISGMARPNIRSPDRPT